MGSFEQTEKLWEDILTATNRCKYEEAIGLRNRLFLDLNEKVRIKNSLIVLIHILFTLFARPRRFKQSIARNNILFYFPYNTNAMFNSLYPVFQEAQKRDRVGLVIKDQTINEIQASIVKNDVFKYSNYLLRIRYLYLSVKATINLRNCLCLIRNESKVNYKFHFVENVFHFYLVFLCQKSFSKIFSVANPSCIISTSDYFPIDYALFATANNLKVPSYVIQHGIIGMSYFPFTASVLCVHGEYSFDDLVRKGCPKDKLAMTGMPASDSLFINKKLDLRIEKMEGVTNVLFLSDTQGASVYPAVYKEYFEVLSKTIDVNAKLNWIVKLHPAEDASFYNQLVEKYPDRFEILPKETTLIEAFNKCDIAATIWSTAGLEAMIAGLPLLVFDVTPEVYNYAWWPKFGGGRFFSEVISKDYCLEFNMEDRDNWNKIQHEFLGKYFANSGRASVEVINTILNG